MRAAVAQDYRWQRSYEPQLFGIVRGQAGKIVSVRRSSDTEDLNQATDLVLEIEGRGTVATRVRRPNYLEFDDITIRVARPFCCRVEVHKILDGWAKYYLYAWTNGLYAICKWVFVDLDVVRRKKLIQIWAVNTHETKDGEVFMCIPVSTLRESRAIIAEEGFLP